MELILLCRYLKPQTEWTALLVMSVILIDVEFKATAKSTICKDDYVYIK